MNAGAFGASHALQRSHLAVSQARVTASEPAGETARRNVSKTSARQASCAWVTRAGATAAAAASIAEKSNAYAITTPTGGNKDVRLSCRQPLAGPSRSCRACSTAIATACRRLSRSASGTGRLLASSAALSKLLANTSVGQPIRSMNSTRAAWRTPSRKNMVSGLMVVIRCPYSTGLEKGHAAKVAKRDGPSLQTVIANPVRPISGLFRGAGRVVLPSREPDAVERLPEHHRRAREVIGRGAGGGHGDNVSRSDLAVAPNNQTQFGERFDEAV